LARTFSSSYRDNVALVNDMIGVGTSFDIVTKEFEADGWHYTVYLVNGFAQDLLQLEIIEEITSGALDRKKGESLLSGRLSYPMTVTTKDVDTFIVDVLSGQLGILIEGTDEAAVLDTRSYPDRDPSEPDTERVLTGPRDGFIETILFNVALVRRRMRDPNLRFKLLRAGIHTKVDVALAYVKGYTSEKLVDAVWEKLENIDAAGVAMAEQTVEEALSGGAFWNPFPVARTTERPDVVAESLEEGRVAVMVDTSPMAIVAPMPYLSHLHSPEDYHLSAAAGTFLRWVSLVALIVGTWLTPVWMVQALHPIPALRIIGPSSPPSYSLVAQFLLAEVGIDIIRRALLAAPSTIAQAMSILAAVILGQLATKINLFTPEVLVYSAIAAVALFAVPSLELGMAHRLVRVALIILGGIIGWWGIILGSAGLFALLLSMNSFGLPYLWPLIPFDGKALLSIFVREPLTHRAKGPKRILRLDPRGGTA